MLNIDKNIKLTREEWTNVDKLNQTLEEVSRLLKTIKNHPRTKYDVCFSSRFVDASGNSDRDVYYLDLTMEEKVELLEKVYGRIEQEIHKIIFSAYGKSAEVE